MVNVLIKESSYMLEIVLFVGKVENFLVMFSDIYRDNSIYSDDMVVVKCFVMKWVFFKENDFYSV